MSLTSKMLNDNAASWSESIKAYETSKKQITWKKDEFEPAPQLTMYERRCKERENDPILMQCRDPTKEGARLQKKEEELNRRVKKYHDDIAGRRNIINGEGLQKPKMLMPPPRLRDRHLISHLPNGSAHINCPTVFDEDYVRENVINRKPGKTLRAGVRDFDIVSNRYHENDIEKKNEEFMRTSQTIAAKYWKSRNFDILRGRYYDENKEAEYKQQLDVVNQVNGLYQQSKVPNCIQYAEGNCYNIINHSTSDEVKLKSSQTIEQRKLNRIKKDSVEAVQRQIGEEDNERKNHLRGNRIKYNRWKYQLERGYNPIDLSANVPEPIPVRPASEWLRLHRHENDSFTGQGASTLPLPPRFRISTSYPSSQPQGLEDDNMSYAVDASSGNSSVSRKLTSEQSSSLKLIASNSNSVDVEKPFYNNNRVSTAPISAAVSKVLSNADSVVKADISKSMSARAATARTMQIQPAAASVNSVSVNKRIPSLDLSKAEQPEKVSYSEPLGGHAGLPIAMVRTGGLGSLRG